MWLRRQIEETFGAAVFERPLFYSYPDGLRFELSAGQTAIDQFLTAVSRALSIAEHVFSSSEHFVLCLRARTCGAGWEHRQLLRELRHAGIPIPVERALWGEAVHPDDWADEDMPETTISLAFQVPVALLQSALWCALAPELGISPKLRCAVYLLNLQAGLAVFPYDDRGMDVVGPNHAALRKLYAEHRLLLLPYDLPQMQSTFGTSGAL